MRRHRAPDSCSRSSHSSSRKPERRPRRDQTALGTGTNTGEVTAGLASAMDAEGIQAIDVCSAFPHRRRLVGAAAEGPVNPSAAASRYERLRFSELLRCMRRFAAISSCGRIHTLISGYDACSGERWRRTRRARVARGLLEINDTSRKS